MNTDTTQRRAICLKSPDDKNRSFDLSELNGYLSKGWRIESTTAERVAASKGDGYESIVARGNILVILVKP